MHENRINNMDSFYDESTPQFNVQQNGLKRPLTLDLNGAKQQVKKQRFSGATPAVLSTPDVQMLKMASPELEKFMMSTNGLPTPTPSMVFPSNKVSVFYKIILLIAYGIELHSQKNTSHTHMRCIRCMSACRQQRFRMCMWLVWVATSSGQCDDSSSFCPLHIYTPMTG